MNNDTAQFMGSSQSMSPAKKSPKPAAPNNDVTAESAITDDQHTPLGPFYKQGGYTDRIDE